MLLADNALDRQARTRNALCGLDPRLRTATGESSRLSSTQERLLRGAAHTYRAGLEAIRAELADPRPDREHVLALVERALNQRLDMDLEFTNTDISARICGWMVRECFVDLTRIVDAAVNGEDVLAQARTLVATNPALR